MIHIPVLYSIGVYLMHPYFLSLFSPSLVIMYQILLFKDKIWVFSSELYMCVYFLLLNFSHPFTTFQFHPLFLATTKWWLLWLIIQWDWNVKLVESLFPFWHGWKMVARFLVFQMDSRYFDAKVNACNSLNYLKQFIKWHQCWVLRQVRCWTASHYESTTGSCFWQSCHGLFAIRQNSLSALSLHLFLQSYCSSEIQIKGVTLCNKQEFDSSCCFRLSEDMAELTDLPFMDMSCFGEMCCHILDE